MKTLKQLTKEFNWVNSDITDANFPRINRKHKGYKLFHFGRYISSEDAIKEIQKEGYEPASIHELFEWKYWNKKDTVIALGSVAKLGGGRRVGFLRRDGSERYADLFYFGNDWRGSFRFLGVRSVFKPLDTKTSDPLSLCNLDTLRIEIGGVRYKLTKE